MVTFVMTYHKHMSYVEICVGASKDPTFVANGRHYHATKRDIFMMKFTALSVSCGWYIYL